MGMRLRAVVCVCVYVCLKTYRLYVLIHVELCFVFSFSTGHRQSERGGGGLLSKRSCRVIHFYLTQEEWGCGKLYQIDSDRVKKKKDEKMTTLSPFCLVFLSLCLTHTHNLNTAHTNTKSKTKPGLSLWKVPSVNRLRCKIQALKVSIQSLTVKAEVIETHLTVCLCMSLSHCLSASLSASLALKVQIYSMYSHVIKMLLDNSKYN